MVWRGRDAVVMVALAAFVVLGTHGCSSKKRDGSLAGGADGALGEESLSGSGSLAQAKAGTLGLPGGGPLADIQYSYDSFDLDDAARSTLQGHATWLSDHPGARVEIEGHCDERGTIEYNLALGAKRAATAKSYLASLGVSGERLTTISYGEELPLCHEQQESCFERNRRAHFVVIGE